MVYRARKIFLSESHILLVNNQRYFEIITWNVRSIEKPQFYIWIAQCSQSTLVGSIDDTFTVLRHAKQTRLSMMIPWPLLQSALALPGNSLQISHAHLSLYHLWHRKSYFPWFYPTAWCKDFRQVKFHPRCYHQNKCAKTKFQPRIWDVAIRRLAVGKHMSYLPRWTVSPRKNDEQNIVNTKQSGVQAAKNMGPLISMHQVCR